MRIRHIIPLKIKEEEIKLASSTKRSKSNDIRNFKFPKIGTN